jgi:hypothetical protein
MTLDSTSVRTLRYTHTCRQGTQAIADARGRAATTDVHHAAKHTTDKDIDESSVYQESSAHPANSAPVQARPWRLKALLLSSSAGAGDPTSRGGSTRATAHHTSQRAIDLCYHWRVIGEPPQPPTTGG